MVTGCNKVSPGCRSCYAEVMHRRLMGIASQKEKYSRPFNDGAFPYEPVLGDPFEVKKPSMFFSPSMSDLFHANIPLEYIAKVFAVMFLNPQHTFQVLTKRAERLHELSSEEFYNLFYKYINILHDRYIDSICEEMYQYIEAVDALPLPNVWLGVSCEDQKHADDRIPFLLNAPAAIRFLSCEPLLGPIYLDKYLWSVEKGEACEEMNSIHWVICGGESGRMARPMHPDWARSLRDQCKAADVPFFFKQWGKWNPEMMDDEGTLMYWQKSKTVSGNFLDGKQHLEFPKPMTTKLTPIATDVLNENGGFLFVNESKK